MTVQKIISLTQEVINEIMDDLIFAKITRRNRLEIEKGNYIEMELDKFLEMARKW